MICICGCVNTNSERDSSKAEAPLKQQISITYELSVKCVCVYMFIVLLSYRRPFGTEKEYFVQLFLKYDDSMKLPTVGGLLTKMFKEQKISFTWVLTCNSNMAVEVVLCLCDCTCITFIPVIMYLICSIFSGAIEVAYQGSEVWETVQDLSEDYSRS